MELLIIILVIAMFGGFTKWQRKDIFKRDDATCQNCKRSWNAPHYLMLECHHVIPLNCGGENTNSNGVLLCRSCHAEAHRVLAVTSETQKQRNANAYAYRTIKARIKEKGLKRYGY